MRSPRCLRASRAPCTRACASVQRPLACPAALSQRCARQLERGERRPPQHLSRPVLARRFVQGDNSPALPFTTDNGNWVVDLCFARAVEDLTALADQIKQVAGVVEHGLFLDLSSPDAHILVGGPDGVFSL